MNAKRSLKSISVLLMSLVLVLCMLPTAVFAHTTSGPTLDSTTTGSLTINKTDGAGSPITDTGLQYTIYKVADAIQTTSSGATTLRYILDSGVTLTGGVVGDGATVALPSGTTAADFTGGLPTGTAQTNTGTGTLTFGSLPLGLYLVRETATPAGVTQSNDFLVSIPMSTVAGGVSVWDYDPVATPKNTVVDGKVSKTVTGGGTAVGGGALNTWTASLGNTVTYAITATLPTTFTATPFTTYTVTDIPAAGLNIDLDGTGAAGSFDGVAVSVGAATLVNGTDYTITASGTGFVVELITDVPSGTTPGTQAAALTNGAVVTITYDAQISPSATATSFANAVTVNSQYNTPGGPVTPPGITPPPTDPIPTIVTYNYALQKVDGDNSNTPLAGATFAIQDSSGNYMAWDTTNGWTVASGLSDPNLYTVTSATGTSNAIVSFNGLAGGNYSLVEIAAPSGYSQLTSPIAVTIDATSTADADTSSGGAGYSSQVVNTQASNFVLPGTGGMGIYLYALGGVLLIGAAIVLFTRNRKKRADNA